MQQGKYKLFRHISTKDKAVLKENLFEPCH